MKLKVLVGDFEIWDTSMMLHTKDCVKLGIKEGERARITGKKSLVVFVNKSDTLLKEGCALMSKTIASKIGAKDGDEIDVEFQPIPDSVRFIRKKMNGDKLSRDEINAIISDISESKLSRIEISSWLTTLQIVGMDIDEIADMTVAMVNTGDRIEFSRKPVFDFHSVGGVPGNKVTPIVVSIVAAAGLMIPKTSSRAISSACGTSDFVEVFCEVALTAEQIKNISESTGGVLAWGGSVNLAPVDDMVIKIEYPLGINPRPQMLASIIGKKIAIGATHLLMDIPTGSGTKIPTIEVARAYVRDLMELGDKLGIKIECAITYGDQPVGSAIGPNLEARECLRVLEGSTSPSSVVEKACQLAGIILDMGGILNGEDKAREILSSGKALEKFRDIIEAQGGNRNIKSEDIKPGKYKSEVVSQINGYVHSVDNKSLVQIARAAGSPSDKGAGLLLLKKKGQPVKKGDVILEIYSESEAKCKFAKDLAVTLKPIDIEGMLIEKSIR